MALERTLFIVKPDAVSRNLVGKILAHVEERGFRIVGLTNNSRGQTTPDAVEFAPVPAMIGTRLAARSTATRINSQCSSWSTVGDSPVVPTATMPFVPSAICHSISRR